MLEYGDIGIKEGEDLYRIIRKYGSSDESNGPLVKDVWRAIAEWYDEETAWGMLADALEEALPLVFPECPMCGISESHIHGVD
jgi:hypothetical protein